MGLWNALKNFLFGSGENDPGLYFYVQLYNTPGQPSPDDEIVEVRIHPNNDLSLTDSGEYFVRKLVVGPRQFRRGELVLHFNRHKRVTSREVSGGELVDRQAYQAYLQKVEGGQPSAEAETK